MSKSTIIIPCWRRPEFLAACLHYIQQADGWENYQYYFTIDNKPHAGNDPEVIDVIHSFPGQYEYKVKSNRSHGNSLNLLTAYKEVYQKQKTGLIFMIETDIFIAKDFFSFHEAAQEATDEFFVSACRNQNYKGAKKLPQEPGAIYTFGKYQSLGNSFKAGQLKRVIQHATPAYFSSLASMGNYCRRTWPKSSFGSQWVEQDGLINRVMEAQSLKGVFPYVPRAYHAGFGGYNRPGEMLPKSMSLHDRTQAILNMTEQEMNRRAKSMPDITQCNMQGCEPTPLQMVPPNAIPT